MQNICFKAIQVKLLNCGRILFNTMGWSCSLACIAENGYHGIAKYNWLRNKECLEGEVYPVLYTNSPGLYEVAVTLPSRENLRSM